MKGVIGTSFDYVEEYSLFLNPFIEIYNTNNALDINSFENEENEEFKKAIDKFRGEDQ